MTGSKPGRQAKKTDHRLETWKTSQKSDDRFETWKTGSKPGRQANLTEPEIVELIFAYLALLRGTPVQEWIFREMQNIQEMNFRYRWMSDPVSTAPGLAHGMQEDLVGQVLSAGFILWDSCLWMDMFLCLFF